MRYREYGQYHQRVTEQQSQTAPHNRTANRATCSRVNEQQSYVTAGQAVEQQYSQDNRLQDGKLVISLQTVLLASGRTSSIRIVGAGE